MRVPATGVFQEYPRELSSTEVGTNRPGAGIGTVETTAPALL
jgi:hypothetical protein